MIELPTKNAAAYRTMFARLTDLATRYNDAAGIDENPNPDQFVLHSTSKGLYSNGDKTTYQADLSQGEVTKLAVEVTGIRGPYRAQLTLEPSAGGLQGQEAIHAPNGLVERSFVIEGDNITVRSENTTPGAYRPAAPSPEAERAGQELSSITAQLEYLVAQSF